MVEIIFGRFTHANYARASHFVVFQEVLPKYRFKKIAPRIFFYKGAARIKPIAKSPNLLGDF